ncbi:DUF2243 domain-containing protein [Evansella sp. LMS18]|jgi:uncharacterized membrane protein|uniref:DUF2243 domain-containing protein n=1 Tax=Evansella sp. LMS18 TaxID=2924033 RepID=UPI0020D1E5B2|nr:DUF2243 domain-containing protein [Evansella sp. LMS18]UTR12151.1 DUF2243 domain-containing protein [Evansella sp. LMS18]
MQKTTSAEINLHNDLNKKLAYSKRNLWSGLLFGIGTMAFVDEVIFHFLLQWHHFYDLSTTAVGIFSDGLLMSFAWFAAIGSLFMFADLRRRNALWVKKWVGAVFLGAGIFQLFDGIVNHKILRVHQIRYNVDNILIYDIAWNASAIVLLIIGFVLLKQTRKASSKMKEGS